MQFFSSIALICAKRTSCPPSVQFPLSLWPETGMQGSDTECEFTHTEPTSRLKRNTNHETLLRAKLNLWDESQVLQRIYHCHCCHNIVLNFVTYLTYWCIKKFHTFI